MNLVILEECDRHGDRYVLRGERARHIREVLQASTALRGGPAAEEETG